MAELIILPTPPWRAGRFRDLARDGFLLVGTPGADVAAVPGPAPVRVCELTDIDTTGILAAALNAGPGQVWVIRPDAHIAAVLDRPDPATIERALHRAQGHPVLPTSGALV